MERPARPRRSAASPCIREKYAGEVAETKLRRVAKALSADALLVSDPHALAWAFNLRGADVAHTPIALGYALIPRRGKPRAFPRPGKIFRANRFGAGETGGCRAAQRPAAWF